MQLGKPGGKHWLAVWKFVHAMQSCLMLLEHCMSRAASRAACTAGSNNPIRTPMIVITTSNSTNVNPLVRCDALCMAQSPKTGRRVQP